jgi:hypothetical protein
LYSSEQAGAIGAQKATRADGSFEIKVSFAADPNMVETRWFSYSPDGILERSLDMTELHSANKGTNADLKVESWYLGACPRGMKPGETRSADGHIESPGAAIAKALQLLQKEFR